MNPLLFSFFSSKSENFVEYCEFVFSGGFKVQLCGLAQYGNLIGVTIGYTITASISMV